MDPVVLSALAEPNRRRIVELIREEPLSVGDIALRLGLSQPQASKHLRVLSDAGIVEVQPVANRRIYRLRPEPFAQLAEWVESFRRAWDDRFDRLEDIITSRNRVKEESE